MRFLTYNENKCGIGSGSGIGVGILDVTGGGSLPCLSSNTFDFGTQKKKVFAKSIKVLI